MKNDIKNKILSQAGYRLSDLIYSTITMHMRDRTDKATNNKLDMTEYYMEIKKGIGLGSAGMYRNGKWIESHFNLNDIIMDEIYEKEDNRYS